MIGRIQRGIASRLRSLFAQRYYRTYSQSGEDLIIQSLLEAIGIDCPRYIDVGANDPIRLSNTYLFYQRGAAGVLVEPNPRLVSRLRAMRPRDVICECAVGPAGITEGQLFVLSAHTASTFSASEAAVVCEHTGSRIVETLRMPLKTLETVIREEFADQQPDLLSLDVEGWSEAIVLSTDWRRVRPAVICVETREYAKDYSGRRIESITDMLVSQGYGLAGLTYYNSIFADRERMRHP